MKINSINNEFLSTLYILGFKDVKSFDNIGTVICDPLGVMGQHEHGDKLGFDSIYDPSDYINKLYFVPMDATGLDDVIKFNSTPDIDYLFINNHTQVIVVNFINTTNINDILNNADDLVVLTDTVKVRSHVNMVYFALQDIVFGGVFDAYDDTVTEVKMITNDLENMIYISYDTCSCNAPTHLLLDDALYYNEHFEFLEYDVDSNAYAKAKMLGIELPDLSYAYRFKQLGIVCAGTPSKDFTKHKPVTLSDLQIRTLKPIKDPETIYNIIGRNWGAEEEEIFAEYAHN